MPKTIQQLWDQYNAAVLPADASTLQRVETKRAFYCGAQAVLSILFEMSSDDALTDDQGAEHLESLHRECHDFSRKVARGAA